MSCGSKHRQKEDVSDVAVVADVDGSAIQSQPKEEVFAPPPAEVKLRLIELEIWHHLEVRVSLPQSALGL